MSNCEQLQLPCRTLPIMSMVTFDFGLLALLRPFPGVPRSSIESRTHAGVLTPGIHITGCALDHRWTASRIWGGLICFADREAGEVGEAGRCEESPRNASHGTRVLDQVHVSSILTPFASTSDEHERTRNSRACASDPKHSRPHQSNCCCNQSGMLRPGFCVEWTLNHTIRQRMFLRVS